MRHFRRMIHCIVCLGCIMALVSCSLLNQSDQMKWLKKAKVDNDNKEITTAVNQFGMDYMEKTYIETKENILMSPLSMYIVLSAINHGAIDETNEQISKVLHVGQLSKEDIMKKNAALLQTLYREKEGIDLEIASSIWLTNQYPFKKQYKKDVQHYFTTDLKTADLTSEDTLNEMNDWVEEMSNGQIKEMANQPFSPTTIVVLLNAIYFNGTWKDPFQKDLTDDRVFFLQNDDVKEIPMMYQEGKFYYMESNDVQAIRIPYAEGEIAMYVYLPKEDVALDKWVQQVSEEGLENVLDDMENREGEIYLPKLEYSFELDMQKYLQENGMERAFHEEDAQFSDMLDTLEYVWLSEVRQKTYVHVNEEGTEAASISSGEMEGDYATPPTDSPFVMEVNRPYMFTITDEQTGVDLFIGTIVNPDEEEGGHMNE